MTRIFHKLAFLFVALLAVVANAGLVTQSGPRLYVESEGGGGAWQLAAGHWVAANQTLRVVYPRPNAETSSYSRHRKAYYDAVNSIQYRIPVGVMGGAYPYRYQCTTCPSGASIGEAYGDANYGVFTWTPGGVFSGEPISITVTDQALSTVSVTWTIDTSSSTSDFVFVSTSGNDTTGTGAIGAPFATLQKVLGTTAASSTYPGRIVYFRTGTYAVTSQTGASIAGTSHINSGTKPVAFIGYPGETVTWSFTNAALYANSDDLFFDSLIWDDGVATRDNMQNLVADTNTHRFTASRISITNPDNGDVVDDNATGIIFSNTGSYRDYTYIVDSSESGRTRDGGNCIGFAVMFSARYFLAERNTINSGASHDLWLKQGTHTSERRLNTVVNTNTAEAPWTDDNQPGTGSGPIEDRYNKIRSTFVNAVVLNWRGDTTAIDDRFFNRNSVVGHIDIRKPDNVVGPFVINSNAIQASSPQITQNESGAASGANVQVSNSECHGTSGILDASNNLTGTCLSTWIGQRGAQIE